MMKLVVLALLPLVCLGQFFLFSNYGADSTCAGDIIFEFAAGNGTCTPFQAIFQYISINGNDVSQFACLDSACTTNCTLVFNTTVGTCSAVPGQGFGIVSTSATFPAASQPGYQTRFYSTFNNCADLAFATYYGTCIGDQNATLVSCDATFATVQGCSDSQCGTCTGATTMKVLNTCLGNYQDFCDYVAPTPEPTATNVPPPQPTEWVTGETFVDNCTMPLGAFGATGLGVCTDAFSYFSKVEKEGSLYVEYRCSDSLCTNCTAYENATIGCNFENATNTYAIVGTSATFPSSPYTDYVQIEVWSNDGCQGTKLSGSYINLNCYNYFVHECNATGVYQVQNCTDSACTNCTAITPQFPIFTQNLL
eukprot:TRINITY_DN197_c0_g1_i1.p1 TRINITY_DN197_c0_g1~~TRINITY_DN197_c0_g1_i1.p1  ORF type:complete len:365 (+),score=114.92 TRINITY_DN197_c0_g1_i1:41-1135(+)